MNLNPVANPKQLSAVIFFQCGTDVSLTKSSFILQLVVRIWSILATLSETDLFQPLAVKIFLQAHFFHGCFGRQREKNFRFILSSFGDLTDLIFASKP